MYIPSDVLLMLLWWRVPHFRASQSSAIMKPTMRRPCCESVKGTRVRVQCCNSQMATRRITARVVTFWRCFESSVLRLHCATKCLPSFTFARPGRKIHSVRQVLVAPGSCWLQGIGHYLRAGCKYVMTESSCPLQKFSAIFIMARVCFHNALSEARSIPGFL